MSKIQENEDSSPASPLPQKSKRIPNTCCRSSLWLQIRANMVLSLDAISGGMSLGFTGVCLPALRSDPNLQLSDTDSSLVASLLAVGGFCGGLLMTPLAHRWPRRGSILLGCLFSILGWAGSTVSFHAELLLCSRFLIGMGLGASAGTRSALSAELAEAHLRGLMATVYLFGGQLGIFLVYALGIVCHWRIVCGVGLAMSLSFALGIKFFMPESPRYLLQHGKVREAEESLRMVRCGDVQDELESLRRNVKLQSNDAGDSFTPKDLLSSNVVKPFSIIFLLSCTSRFSGAVGITNFAVDLFPAIGNEMVIDRYLATLLTGLFRVLLAALGSVTIYYFRNRRVLLISGMGMAAGLLTTAVYLHASPGKDGPLALLPYIGVWAYIFFSIPGYSVVLRVLGGELFPLKLRGALTNASTCTSFLTYFLAAQTFPYLLRVLQPFGAFYLFSSVAFVGTTVGFFLTPETSGKTLEEIEDGFSAKKKTSKLMNGAVDAELATLPLQSTKI